MRMYEEIKNARQFNFTFTVLSLGGVYLTLINGTLLSCHGGVNILKLIIKTSCSRL